MIQTCEKNLQRAGKKPLARRKQQSDLEKETEWVLQQEVSILCMKSGLIIVKVIQYKHLFDGKWRKTLEEITEDLGGCVRPPRHTSPEALRGGLEQLMPGDLTELHGSVLKFGNVHDHHPTNKYFFHNLEISQTHTYWEQSWGWEKGKLREKWWWVNIKSLQKET